MLLALCLASGAARADDRTRFNICYDFSCKSNAEVVLDASDWESIDSLFAINPDAAAERAAVASAIALFERISGAQTGTTADRGGNIAGSGLPGQMDCIDESTNTTIYLALLNQRGLLRWHRPAPRRLRAPWLFDQHWTAVLAERSSRAEYAVDAWYLDNGQRPFVLPLVDWLSKAALPPHPDLEQPPARPRADAS